MYSFTSWEVGAAGSCAILSAIFLGLCSYSKGHEDAVVRAFKTFAHNTGMLCNLSFLLQ
jgi:hypothetical protein